MTNHETNEQILYSVYYEKVRGLSRQARLIGKHGLAETYHLLMLQDELQEFRDKINKVL
jgi:hypothetical protein